MRHVHEVLDEVRDVAVELREHHIGAPSALVMMGKAKGHFPLAARRVTHEHPDHPVLLDNWKALDGTSILHRDSPSLRRNVHQPAAGVVRPPVIGASNTAVEERTGAERRISMK